MSTSTIEMHDWALLSPSGAKCPDGPMAADKNISVTAEVESKMPPVTGTPHFGSNTALRYEHTHHCDSRFRSNLSQCTDRSWLRLALVVAALLPPHH